MLAAGPLSCGEEFWGCRGGGACCDGWRLGCADCLYGCKMVRELECGAGVGSAVGWLREGTSFAGGGLHLSMCGACLASSSWFPSMKSMILSMFWPPMGSSRPRLAEVLEGP
ncbi:hypothetical protein E2C01_005389 [Portunus trituberculatus]|uniref:Uncharacterized protein n=1 Tax=Portunus trituberculatus TaxID=210409 RepID=A0A5B7CVE9_PORTR|nr:hypothetical protein [Portunus trituberculatus]